VAGILIDILTWAAEATRGRPRSCRGSSLTPRGRSNVPTGAAPVRP